MNEPSVMVRRVPRSGWIQLLLGLIVMMAISSPQYVWTLFAGPFGQTTHASASAVQVTFSILVVLQTWLAPVQGFFIDRIGPRLLVASGAALSGLGWVTASYADSLVGLYLTYGLLCGIGTGFVYVGVVGLMVRWFADRRGLAVGAVAAGYGMGALLTTFPIATMIKASGYRPTLVVFGLVLGAVGLLAALFLRNPAATEIAAPSARLDRGGTSPGEMLQSPVFWLMFVMMTMMSTGGLMVTSQFAAFAKDFGVADALVFGLTALPLALTFDRITNGLTRPFFGWLSDRMGRENTMALAFGLEAVAISLLLVFRADPVAFVVLSGVVFFGWGEIFSLFPSTLTTPSAPASRRRITGFFTCRRGSARSWAVRSQRCCASTPSRGCRSSASLSRWTLSRRFWRSPCSSRCGVDTGSTRPLRVPCRSMRRPHSRPLRTAFAPSVATRLCQLRG